jgi:hypothetical protein
MPALISPLFLYFLESGETPVQHLKSVVGKIIRHRTEMAFLKRDLLVH